MKMEMNLFTYQNENGIDDVDMYSKSLQRLLSSLIKFVEKMHEFRDKAPMTRKDKAGSANLIHFAFSVNFFAENKK